MATYTSKLNLKKPAQTDFYNIDDFNENADKIDAFASTSSLKTFTDLTQIGLTLGSETIESIASALPENSMLFISVGSASNKDIYPGYTSGARYGVLRVTKRETDRILFEFFYLPDSTIQYTRYWMGLYSTTWYGWYESISESGGTFYGNVRINKYATPSLELTTNKSSAQITKNASDSVEDGLLIKDSDGTSASDYVTLRLNHMLAKTDISQLLKVSFVKNGTHSFYKIFGEHNLPNAAQVFSGTYDGNGNSGSAYANILPAFNFTPKIVIIEGWASDVSHNYKCILFNGNTVGVVYTFKGASGYEFNNVNVTWTNNTVQWYLEGSNTPERAISQLNKSRTTYHYIAIG